MCPRCNGYLVRDHGFEFDTDSKVAFHCVNCGCYMDRTILRNKQSTPIERECHAEQY